MIKIFYFKGNTCSEIIENLGKYKEYKIYFWLIFYDNNY